MVSGQACSVTGGTRPLDAGSAWTRTHSNTRLQVGPKGSNNTDVAQHVDRSSGSRCGVEQDQVETRLVRWTTQGISKGCHSSAGMSASTVTGQGLELTRIRTMQGLNRIYSGTRAHQDQHGARPQQDRLKASQEWSLAWYTACGWSSASMQPRINGLTWGRIG